MTFYVGSLTLWSYKSNVHFYTSLMAVQEFKLSTSNCSEGSSSHQSNWLVSMRHEPISTPDEANIVHTHATPRPCLPLHHRYRSALRVLRHPVIILSWTSGTLDWYSILSIPSLYPSRHLSRSLSYSVFLPVALSLSRSFIVKKIVFSFKHILSMILWWEVLLQLKWIVFHFVRNMG